MIKHLTGAVLSAQGKFGGLENINSAVLAPLGRYGGLETITEVLRPRAFDATIIADEITGDMLNREKP